MKKVLFLLALLPAFLSCKDESVGCRDIIWDFAPWDIILEITDNQGKDLLDESNPDNILDVFAVEYREKMYPIGQYSPEDPRYQQTRAYLPLPLALWVDKHRETGKNILRFGEFVPDGNYKKESLKIHWGDGRINLLEFDLFLTWKNCDPTVHAQLYVDGEVASENSLSTTFVYELPGMEWDFVPWNITIGIFDAAGGDLLSQYYENNILDVVSILYKDEIHSLARTKAFPATFNGLRVNDDDTAQCNYLIFGEFGPDINYQKEPFFLKLSEDTVLPFEFDLYVEWKDDKPVVHTNVYFEGEEVSLQGVVFGDYRLNTGFSPSYQN